MQNKGLIKFFAIIFTIACIYQLSFTFVANGIVKDAKEFAKGDSQKELNYLKSLKKRFSEKLFFFIKIFMRQTGNTFSRKCK